MIPDPSPIRVVLFGKHFAAVNVTSTIVSGLLGKYCLDAIEAEKALPLQLERSHVRAGK